MKNKLTFIIEDISDGQELAYAATCPELHNAVAMGDDMKELFEGVDLSLECARDYKVGAALKAKEFRAVLHDYGDSVVIAPTLQDLRTGVESAIKMAKEKGARYKFMTLTFKRKKSKPRKKLL